MSSGQVGKLRLWTLDGVSESPCSPVATRRPVPGTAPRTHHRGPFTQGEAGYWRRRRECRTGSREWRTEPKTCCVTLGEPFLLSEPQFAPLYNGD